MFFTRCTLLPATLLGSLILGGMRCAAIEELLQAQAPEVGEQIVLLASPDRPKRASAAAYLSKWATEQEPAVVVPLLLKVTSKSAEPEARERCLQVLRFLALRDYGKTGEGYLGIQMGEELPVKVIGMKFPCLGQVVSAVTTDSPAQKAGFMAGDIVVSLNGEFFTDRTQTVAVRTLLSEQIRRVGAGNKALFGVYLNGVVIPLTATLTRRPADLENATNMMMFANGKIQIDQDLVKDQMEKDKNSEAYFNEWLQQQWEKYPVK